MKRTVASMGRREWQSIASVRRPERMVCFSPLHLFWKTFFSTTLVLVSVLFKPTVDRGAKRNREGFGWTDGWMDVSQPLLSRQRGRRNYFRSIHFATFEKQNPFSFRERNLLDFSLLDQLLWTRTKMGKTTTSVTSSTTQKKKVATSFKKPVVSTIEKKLPAMDRVLQAIVALEQILGRQRLPRKQVVAWAHIHKLATELCVLSKLQMEGRIWYNKSTIRMTEKGRLVSTSSRDYCDDA